MIIEILGEEVVNKGNYKCVRRWLRGQHPDLGIIVRGYTGWETVQEVRMSCSEPEILGEQVISQNGSYKHVRRWLRGVHPELGKLVRGITGWETLQEIDVIKAKGTFFDVSLESDLRSVA